MNKTELLEEYLSDYIQKIGSGEIYEHGYPEARLIPANHCKECEESFIDMVIDEVLEDVRGVLQLEVLKNQIKFDNY